MNENGLRSQELSEDEAVNGDRLVPVGEAIRYRKRAQNAESKVSELSEELEKANSNGQQLASQLESIRLENSLVSKLVAAGTNDLEAVLLLSKKRLGASEDNDVDQVVEQLKKDKEHLFVLRESVSVASRTSGVKQRVDGSKRGLEKVAQKASLSGSRVDVQEYMRARRQFVR